MYQIIKVFMALVFGASKFWDRERRDKQRWFSLYFQIAKPFKTQWNLWILPSENTHLHTIWHVSSAHEPLSEMPKSHGGKVNNWCWMLKCQEESLGGIYNKKDGHEWRWATEFVCFTTFGRAGLAIKSPGVNKSGIIHRRKKKNQSLSLNVVIISI